MQKFKKLIFKTTTQGIINNLNKEKILTQTEQEFLNAIKLFNYDEAEKLLSKYKVIDISIKDSLGNSPLHYAARGGCIKLLPQLSKNVINNINKEGNTALHFAAHYGHIDVFKSLQTLSADSSIKNAKDLTPFDVALIHGHLPIAKDFLGNYTIHPLIVHKMIEEAVKPYLPLRSEQENIFNDYSERNTGIFSTLQFLINKGRVLMQTKDDNGNTILHTAIFAADNFADAIPVIQILVGKLGVKSYLDIKNNNGKNPKELAEEYFTSSTEKKAIKEFFKELFAEVENEKTIKDLIKSGDGSIKEVTADIDNLVHTLDEIIASEPSEENLSSLYVLADELTYMESKQNHP